MSIKLIGNRIMALPCEEEKMKGLIILPDKRNKKKDERPEQFDILAVGPDVKDIKAGDRVIAGKYAACKEMYDGKEYYFLSEDACFAVMEQPSKFQDAECDMDAIAIGPNARC